MTRDVPPMDATRFAALLAAYGARPERWPERERPAAQALLASSPAARAHHEAALRLDELLDLAPAATPSADLTARVLASAPRAATRRAPAPRPQAQAARRAPASASRRWLVRALPFAAAAALAVWLVRTPDPAVTTLPDPEMVAALGDYETPGDALLAFSAGERVDDEWSGCPDAVLGCLELETLSLEPVSDAGERRITS